MKAFTLVVLPITVVSCAIPNSASAITVVQTGADLYVRPDVSFPTTVPVLNGPTLEFGTDNVANSTMLR